jgi:SAM-dependent methyltransferase
MLVCDQCGFGQIADGEHTSDYWARKDNVEHEVGERYWTARLAVYRRALISVERVTGPGRLVDLGGGVGHFAECALERGWDAYSVDVSEHAAAAAAARVGEARSLISTPDSMDGTCDLVTLWCVVAHVPDPRAVLADALRLLKPGGRLLMTTPNLLFQSRYAALASRLGRPLDFVASDHVLHFTPRSIDRLLADAGATRRTFAYWGVTADCLLERRLARVLVPCKRLWNRGAWALSKLGGPALYSELHVEGVRA